MKLLICTQKVDRDDPILGFFHAWIVEFAKNFEFVTVVCLYEGKHDLPENVKVLSLGKEERQSRLQYLIHFYWYIITERKNYDAVFVHMNQIYIVLGGILWKILGKEISLWYTHRAISMDLKIATFFSNKIFTASKESFTLPSNKVSVMGHGIDINKFVKNKEYPHNDLSILSVGRITRIKNIETLIEAIKILKDKNIKFICRILGPIITEDDQIYKEILRKSILDKDLEKNILFLDPVSNDDIKEYYWNSDININLTPTGGMDKVVLEGIIAKSIPLTSNKTFKEIFGDYSEQLIFEYQNPVDLANKIVDIKIVLDNNKIKNYLFNRVSTKFNVINFIKTMSDKIKS